MTLATNWVGNRFDCLAYTLEMPFKDNANLPDDDFGWNGQRSLRLGEAMLSAVLNVVDDYDNYFSLSHKRSSENPNRHFQTTFVGLKHINCPSHKEHTS